MDRDARRDRGQWRGCHTFKDIVCDGDRPSTSRRDGGLRMGQPYYFYYEVDGSYETHDESLPSTSACPFLPGQTVNVMDMPAQVSDRQRSASLGSICYEDFMTMDPSAKFSAPRRAPPPPAIPDFLGPRYRLPTAPTPSLKHKVSNRSLSPGTPNWWSPRKLFTRKQSTSSVHSIEVSGSETSWSDSAESSSSLSATSRAMSPDQLRRFLSDETPRSSLDAESSDRLALSIPDDIAEEEDDDEFAVSSAVSECGPKTILSPPPQRSRHGSSSNTIRRLPDNGSTATLKAFHPLQPAPARPHIAQSYTYYQKPAPQDSEDRMLISRFSFSSSDDGSAFDDDEVDPLDTSTEASEIPSFYHSEAEEDDDLPDCLSPPINFGSKQTDADMEHSLARAFEGYRLPMASSDGNNKHPESTHRAGEASVVSSPPLLALPIMDDFASELKSAGLF